MNECGGLFLYYFFAHNVGTEIITMTYPNAAVPSQYDLGSCDGTTSLHYSPAEETFGIFNIGFGGDAQEVEGPEFNKRTMLARRPEYAAFTKNGKSNGLLVSHDTFDLVDNKWSEIAGVETPAGYPYSAGMNVGGKIVGTQRFFQQYYLWPDDVTLDISNDKLKVKKCNLLHLAYFSRYDGDAGLMMARWRFQSAKFSASEVLKDAKTAVRYVDAHTIGIEIEKQRFQQLTNAKGEVLLPEFVADDGTTYVRLYEWKTKVYCTNASDSVGTLPQMTSLSDTNMRVIMKSGASAADVESGRLTPGIFQEGRGSASYKLSTVEIPNDGQPVPFLTWDEPIFETWGDIQLEIRWSNLPPVAECPILVWDPTFHALPPAGTPVSAAPASTPVSAAPASNSVTVVVVAAAVAMLALA